MTPQPEATVAESNETKELERLIWRMRGSADSRNCDCIGNEELLRKAASAIESLLATPQSLGGAVTVPTQDALDARRYRWLRDSADRDDEGHCYIAQDNWIGDGEDDDAEDSGVSTNWLQGDEADAVIDAALTGGKDKP